MGRKGIRLFRKLIDEKVVSAINSAARAQAPLAHTYTRFIRDRHPAEQPDQIIERMERHYLTLVTASGVAVGLSAAVPGVGTLVAIAATAADTVLFVEASVVFTVAVSEVADSDPAPQVSAIVLGTAGTSALGAAGRSARQWDSLVASKIPGLSRVPDSPVKRFAVQFLIRRGALAFGKIIPAGIGAVIGGAGNRAMAHLVIRNLRVALHPPAHVQSLPGESVHASG